MKHRLLYDTLPWGAPVEIARFIAGMFFEH